MSVSIEDESYLHFAKKKKTYALTTPKKGPVLPDDSVFVAMFSLSFIREFKELVSLNVALFLDDLHGTITDRRKFLSFSSINSYFFDEFITCLTK